MQLEGQSAPPHPTTPQLVEQPALPTRRQRNLFHNLTFHPVFYDSLYINLALHSVFYDSLAVFPR